MAIYNGKEILFNPQLKVGASDYDELANKPIINQDLSADGFTPETGTYYRHIGTGGGGSVAGTPLAVGDNVADVYFDTSVDVLSLFAGVEDTSENVISFTEISDTIFVKYVGGVVIVARVVDEAPVTVYYMSQDVIGAGWTGWNTEFSGSDTFNATVNSIVAGSDNYLSFISKTPFTSGSAYTTGAIYYYNGTEYKAITGEAGETETTDYNQIENIPVINQDLSASGFTPTANTYYRHTGTTDTYTQGVIYYYDGTEYKALDGSGGGGTTLNKYIAHGNARLMSKIIFNAKSIIAFTNIAYSLPLSIGIREDAPMFITCSGNAGNGTDLIVVGFRITASGTRENPTSAGTDQKRIATIKSDGTIETAVFNPEINGYYIEYFNDVEITL